MRNDRFKNFNRRRDIPPSTRLSIRGLLSGLVASVCRRSACRRSLRPRPPIVVTPTRGDSSGRVHRQDSDDLHVAARRDEFVTAEKEPRVEAWPVEGESEFDALRPPYRLVAGAEGRAGPIGARPRKQRDASAKSLTEFDGAPRTTRIAGPKTAMG